MNVEMMMAVSSSSIPVTIDEASTKMQVSVADGSDVEMNASASSQNVPVAVDDATAIQSEIGVAYYSVQGEIYDGSYSVVPSDHEQILQTANKAMLRDFVIAPIPSNYGKITYNGSVITVS